MVDILKYQNAFGALTFITVLSLDIELWDPMYGLHKL